MDTSKACYQFTWNPALPNGDSQFTFVNFIGDGSYGTRKGGEYGLLRDGYSGTVDYFGQCTVKLNTTDIGCTGGLLLTDLYGNQLMPYTKTFTFA